MSIIIEKAIWDDWEPSMELCWRVFLRYVAPGYSEEGIENFLNFISGEELYKMFLQNNYKMVVAKDNDKIIGVATLRGQSHISLLFVDQNYHNQGIGKGLLKALQEEKAKHGDVILTVNASPYGVSFYKKIGFMETDFEKLQDGIRFTPMTCVTRIN